MKPLTLLRSLLLGITLALPLTATVQAQSAGRVGTVESVRQETVQESGSTLGTVGGAVVGGVLGNQIGQGRGRTLATVGGAAGGAVVGNRMTSGTSTIWVVTVRYEDGTTANIEQSSQPPLRSGDRVRVTNGNLELMR
jgi:outer membrane lipoprotein SlyB